MICAVFDNIIFKVLNIVTKLCAFEDLEYFVPFPFWQKLTLQAECENDTKNISFKEYKRKCNGILYNCACSQLKTSSKYA